MKLFIFLLAFFVISDLSANAQIQDSKTDSVLLEYYQSQKYADAVKLLNNAYPAPVSNSKIICQLAYANKMANRLPQAEAYYHQLYDKDSCNLAVLFNIASINYQRGKAQIAADFYKRILTIDSNNFSAHKQLALISAAKSDIPSEVKYLQKANTINPADPDIAFDLSQIFLSLKQLPQAQKIIDEALKSDTANLFLLKGKVQVCYALRKYPETINICNMLIAGLDRSNQVITYKAIAEYNLKEYKDCIATFSLLDSSNTQGETSFYYTGISYKMLHDNNRAIQYLQKAVSQGISPNIADYYSEIADSYEQLHLPKKAISAYQRALTFEEKPLAIYSLASIYDSNLRDTINALKYYKKYLRIKPQEDKQRSYIDYTTRRIADLSK